MILGLDSSISNVLVDDALKNSVMLWVPHASDMVSNVHSYKRYFVKGGYVIAGVSIRGAWRQICTLKVTGNSYIYNL